MGRGAAQPSLEIFKTAQTYGLQLPVSSYWSTIGGRHQIWGIDSAAVEFVMDSEKEKGQPDFAEWPLLMAATAGVYAERGRRRPTHSPSSVITGAWYLRNPSVANSLGYAHGPSQYF